MAVRFFQNPMPEFVPEATPSTPQEQEEALTVGDSLTKLVAMPHAPLSERLKRAALDLKETVPNECYPQFLLFLVFDPRFSALTRVWFGAR